MNDEGKPDDGETIRMGDAPPTWAKRAIAHRDGSTTEFCPSESGQAVTFNRENGVLSFLSWDTMPYEGHNVGVAYDLGYLLSGLGITLEDCKAALEGDAR